MSIRPHHDLPCWEIVRADTGFTPEGGCGDGWPHYLTRDAAFLALVERGTVGDLGADLSEYSVQESFGGPCVGLFCDGPDCKAKDDPCDMSGEGWTHLDPLDPLPVPVADFEWFETDDGKHYCEDCIPPWCEDCDERHHAGAGCDGAA